MKKIRKMDEMELIIALKINKLCYLALSVCIVILCVTEITLDMFTGITNFRAVIYLTILLLVNVLGQFIGTLVIEFKIKGLK